MCPDNANLSSKSDNRTRGRASEDGGLARAPIPSQKATEGPNAGGLRFAQLLEYVPHARPGRATSRYGLWIATLGRASQLPSELLSKSNLSGFPVAQVSDSSQ